MKKDNPLLEQLEQKIRQSIPELKEVSRNGITRTTQIMLNHVLEYARQIYVKWVWGKSYRDFIMETIPKWNLKSAYLKDQSEELINFLNELK